MPRPRCVRGWGGARVLPPHGPGPCHKEKPPGNDFYQRSRYHTGTHTSKQELPGCSQTLPAGFLHPGSDCLSEPGYCHVRYTGMLHRSEVASFLFLAPWNRPSSAPPRLPAPPGHRRGWARPPVGTGDTRPGCGTGPGGWSQAAPAPAGAPCPPVLLPVVPGDTHAPQTCSSHGAAALPPPWCPRVPCHRL